MTAPLAAQFRPNGAYVLEPLSRRRHGGYTAALLAGQPRTNSAIFWTMFRRDRQKAAPLPTQPCINFVT
jgi:hypothetical protein